MKNRYEVRGDVTCIFVPSKRGGPLLECLIDTADLPLVSGIPGRWGVAHVKSMNSYYAVWCFGRLKMHRHILQSPDALVIDHVNHNTLDNRRENLRAITHGQNLQNQRLSRNNKSGMRGVHWQANRQRWIAQVKVNNRRHRRYFKTKEEAVTAVLQMRAELMPFNATD